MSLLHLFVTFALMACILARSIPAAHVRHEEHQPHWQQHWTKRERVPPTTLLPVRIGLAQPGLQEGHDLLMEISNPASLKYGQHLTLEEVTNMFAPTRDSVDAVIHWLTSSDINASSVSQSTNKQWIQFDATASQLERLLHTEYFVWEDSTGSKDVSCEMYHVPNQIREHIDYITPGIRLRSEVKRKKRSFVPLPKTHSTSLKKRGRLSQQTPVEITPYSMMNETSCEKFVTVACIRAQYGIPAGTTATPGNELGIFENDNDHYSRVDLDTYWSTLEPYIPNGTYPSERRIDGAVGAVEEDYSVGWGVESDLDFQVSQPLIWPQKTVLFQEDYVYYDSDDEEPSANDTTMYRGYWNTFFDAIDGSYCSYRKSNTSCGTTCPPPVIADPNPYGHTGMPQCGSYKPTNVISISYAFGENMLPASYLRRQCNELLKLSLQGTTVVVSSGDGGVGSSEGCSGNDHQIFQPLTPGSCPYALSVGSTKLVQPEGCPNNETCKLGEVPTTRFGSGGGFSNVFPVPDYQKGAVETYFNTTSLNFTGYSQFVDGTDFSNVTSGLYHIGGRGVPDVAAIGDHFVIYWNGTWNKVGGTSISAPLWGAILTLANEERLAKNMSTIGFVHPLLYAHPEAFTDMTTGSNPGCNTSYSNGFPAARGWDPVSGLGSPIFSKILDVLVNV